MSIIIQAAQFAAAKHAGQLRKWTQRPYIEHPGRVAAAVTLLPGVSDEIIAAAWLHDVLEDCEQCDDDEDVWLELGEGVNNLVHELTNTSKRQGPVGQMLPRAERKRLDRERIAKCSAWARRLKAIDRYDNLGELDHVAAGDFAALYLIESKQLSDALRATSASDDILCELLDALDDRIRLLTRIQQHTAANAAQESVATRAKTNTTSPGGTHAQDEREKRQNESHL